MKPCLFCESVSAVTTKEHIIPESLGNDDLLLIGQVCDKCQNYFGKEVENFVLSRTPFALWRAHLGIRTKRGELPQVDLSQPEIDKGAWKDRHRLHDNGVGFSFHEDGSVSMNIEDSTVAQEVHEGRRTQFRFVFTPKVLFMMSRFLIKVGIELVCYGNSEIARNTIFDKARRYARHGGVKELWPIFHFSDGTISNLRWIERDLHGMVERFVCYEYRLFEVPRLIPSEQPYTLFQFKVGTDVWIVCLSDPYPHPVIRSSFPGKNLDLIWYSPE